MKKDKMKKVMRLFLMLCLILSGALSYAHNTGTTEKEIGRGIPIEIIEAINVSGLAKSNAIIPTLDGHLLTVVFSENLGQVAVVVTTALGGAVECLSITTPNGLQIYIPNTGDYIVTFTLPNGDEYYGEFTVTN